MRPRNLYHYTSNECFIAILDSQQIHLTALDLSNDWLEGHTFEHVLRSACFKARISKTSEDLIFGKFRDFRSLILGFGFCLTVNKDQLSQWRGYANDATGVAIGFRTDFLETGELPRQAEFPEARLKQVLYSEDLQADAVKPFAEELVKIANALPVSHATYMHGNEDAVRFLDEAYQEFRSDISSSFIKFIGSIFQFKSIAFQEEREWRLLHEDMLFRINGRHKMRSLSFRANGARVLPYVPIHFGQNFKNLISEVVLGPKNQTPTAIMEALLDRHGLGNVVVTRSEASFR